MANKLKDTAPRPRIGKTAKDTRMARLIDINQVVDEVNNELFIIEGEKVIQDMRLTALEAVPAPTPNYLSFVGTLTQSGVDAMTFTEIFNDTGITPTTSYGGFAGFWFLQFGIDTYNPVIFINGVLNGGLARIYYAGGGQFRILSTDFTGTGTNGLLNSTEIEIRFYPVV